jgi:hypothetical protein
MDAREAWDNHMEYGEPMQGWWVADARAALTGKADQAVAGAVLDCVCGMGFGPCKDPECKAPILTRKDKHDR